MKTLCEAELTACLRKPHLTDQAALTFEYLGDHFDHRIAHDFLGLRLYGTLISLHSTNIRTYRKQINYHKHRVCYLERLLENEIRDGAFIRRIYFQSKAQFYQRIARWIGSG